MAIVEEDRAETLWNRLHRTKAKKKLDIETIQTTLVEQEQGILRAVSDFVSLQAIQIAKTIPDTGERAARQSLLVRALAEVATKILKLRVIREVEPQKNDAPETTAGQTL